MAKSARSSNRAFHARRNRRERLLAPLLGLISPWRGKGRTPARGPADRS